MRKTIFLLMVFLSVAAVTFAETVVLKNGKTVEGKIISKTDTSIKIDIIGIPVTYYFDDIVSIDGKTVSSSQPEPVKEPKATPEVPAEEKINLEPPAPKKVLSLGEVKEAQEYFQKASNYFRDKKYDEAIAEFEKALKIDPNFSESYYGLGYAYCYKNQCEASLSYFQKAIELSPNYADAYNAMAYAYSVLGKYNDSITYYLKALKIKEDNLDALNGLGYAYASIGKYEDAINYFKKAIKINPDYAPAYSGLGVLYYSLTQFLDAKENLMKAKELFKKNNDDQGVKAVEEYLNKLPENH